MSPIALVRSLDERVDGLYAVSEVCQVLAESALEATGAEASAVMVPDQDTWRTVAGVNLRALEHRYAIEDGHWLIRNVVRPGRGMIVEHSDIVRRQMQGAPLASRNHLMAVPVPDTSVVVIAAREVDERFTEQDLAVLDSLAKEGRFLVSDALAVRTLARRMQRFLEHPDD